ncbi:MAG: dual specificity protein phosphatase family protein, partial [Chloroflexi bacterium]|nr:dual specificity protein phosphatase family protein [Chloroflexota bacterium]
MPESNTLGNTLTELPFDLTGRIFRSPMPFGPYDWQNEVWPAYQENDVSAVVVLIEPQEYLVHARRDLLAFYHSAGLDVIHLPIPDFRIPPDVNALEDAIAAAIEHAQAGGNLAAHCMAGMGRTGTFMACMAKRHLSLDGVEAIDWVRQSIPGAMENSLQEHF